MKALVNLVKTILVTVGILAAGYLAFMTYFDSHAITNMGGDARAIAIDPGFGDCVFVVAEVTDDSRLHFENLFGSEMKMGFYAIPADQYVDLGEGRFIDRVDTLVFK